MAPRQHRRPGDRVHRRGRARTLASAAVLAFVVGAVSYASVEPASPVAITAETVPAAPDTPSRIRYGDAADTFGDLYLPNGTGPHPVVVLIHGGGWSQHRSLAGFARHSRQLAEHGVAVWNIEYRRVNGEGGWPTTLTDVDDAVTALAGIVQQRSGNRLDLGQVHLAGHSSGGQLAAWAAARHSAPARRAPSAPVVRIRSATLLAAVLDMRFAVTDGRDAYVRRLLGGGPDEVPDRYRMASPIAHLPTGVHITAVHGDGDRIVALEQSRRYIAAAGRAGLAADLRILPGTGHAEFVDADSAAWTAARTTILNHVTAALR
ncbi:alpha/beta hydrolase family protein [Nocardia mexicana]|uniref:alpha/beta hydrolase family protein n=1 Tax=Nocardia mexicana TaxID=279262 RepID=UPI001FE8C778|nr:alpha/beta fold hydrolase [Nocardia mexicana]